MFIVSWFLAIFWISSVLNEECDIIDHNCITKGANHSFGPFVNGIDNIVEASDPLKVDLIEDKQPTLTYKLTNASLIGMKDCVLTSLKIDKEALCFLFNLECPHIVVKTDYEVKGNIVDLYAEGKGILTITADDYVFMFNCEYEKTISEDNKTHVQIQRHNFDVDARGKVTFDLTNLFNGDKKKSDIVHNFINENWRIVDNLFLTTSIDRFMELFIGYVLRQWDPESCTEFMVTGSRRCMPPCILEGHSLSKRVGNNDFRHHVITNDDIVIMLI